MAEKPWGEIMDEMDNDAKHLPVDNIMQEILVTMRHARIFIASREKMHPTGIQLYDELLWERINDIRVKAREALNGAVGTPAP
jgi:hypothetical protein